jgi:hypothetical protein
LGKYTSESDVTPTGTTVETPTSGPNQQTITVRIVMPNGEDIAGAPWDLYAPVASQVAVQPYRSGVVGAGNTIELIDLPHGSCQLVIRPEGSDPVEVALVIDSTSGDGGVRRHHRDVRLRTPTLGRVTSSILRENQIRGPHGDP